MPPPGAEDHLVKLWSWLAGFTISTSMKIADGRADGVKVLTSGNCEAYRIRAGFLPLQLLQEAGSVQ